MGRERRVDMSPPPPQTRPAARAKTPPKERCIDTGGAHLEWVPVSQMRISPRAQRKHDGPSSRAKIEYIATHFDPDKAGTPTVNHRDGIFWVIDGGHRYLALVEMGWEDQSIQCWTFRDLSEAEEADMFLSLNDVKPVSGMDKFQRALVAKRPLETDINRVVQSADLTIGTGRDAIACVGAITKTYNAGGPRVLATTLRIIRDSYGMPGFTSKVTEGVGLFVANYENTFAEGTLVERLSAKKGGVNGLVGEAGVVETYNRGRGGAKLNGWWSTFNNNNEGEQ
jgi:hypothetical protein